MASVIHCTRCQRDTEGLGKAPLPAPHGDELLSHTCPDCFKDWMGTEIMIINEYKLDLGVPRNQDMLNEEMARFLNLPSGGGEAAAGAPPQATPQAGPQAAPQAGPAHDHGHAHGKKTDGCC